MVFTAHSAQALATDSETSTVSIRHHLGIRYARLEHGQRFDASVPVPLEQGLEEAGRFHSSNEIPVFPQLPSRLDAYMGSPAEHLIQDEDAFYMNIFVPTGRTSLPVIVFVHGGAWVSGAGTFDWYNGSRIAQQGICVVTINYRIHATGHLADSAQHRPLQDLEVGLEWVQENIHRFGGDPGNVTLVGQSAGGWYVHALACLERLRGKIRKIALLSMGTRAPWSRENLERIRREISLRNHDADLRTLPVEQLLKEALVCSRTGPPTTGESTVLGYTPAPLLPAVSTDLEQDFLEPGISAERLVVDEILFRYTADETGVFLANSQPALQATAQQVAESLASFVPATDQIPGHLRQRMNDPGRSPYQRLRAITSWAQFQRLPNQLAAAYRAAGKHVELHEFNVPSSDADLGACHCLDLPYQFGNRDAWKHAPMLAGITAEQFGRSSHALIRQLAEFVLR